MSAYISYGGGVDSTAMTILILTDDRFADLRDGLRIVFADTGAETTETLCYVRYFDGWLQKHYGLNIEIVRSDRGTLLDHCRKYNIIPSRIYRWCTVEYKTKPLTQWAAEHGLTTCLIGFDLGEEHRAAKDRNTNHRYPLIEAELDREGCKRLIQSVGLELPRKSGCFCCPFGSKSHFEDLRTYHPDLWQLTLELERAAYEKGTKSGKHFCLKDKPLDEWLQNPSLELFEPCHVCELTEDRQ